MDTFKDHDFEAWLDELAETELSQTEEESYIEDFLYEMTEFMPEYLRRRYLVQHGYRIDDC